MAHAEQYQNFEPNEISYLFIQLLSTLVNAEFLALTAIKKACISASFYYLVGRRGLEPRTKGL